MSEEKKNVEKSVEEKAARVPYKNPVKEAAAFWKECVVGKKTRSETGAKIITKEPAYRYSKGKVIGGTAIMVAGAIGVGIGTVFGVNVLKGKFEDDDVDLLEDGGDLQEVTDDNTDSDT